MAGLSFTQIGLNTIDMAASLRFYAEIFGFANAGGQAAWGDAMRIQGLDPSGQMLAWWMVGRHRRLQFEIFEHSGPGPRPQPADWSPADHGWVRFGLAVADFDGVGARLAARGIGPLGGMAVTNGIRHFAVRDPYVGVIIEIWEDGPGLPGGSRPRDNEFDPLILYVTSSVSDLAAARHFYGDILGLALAPLETLHAPSDEALWGLAGAARSGFVADGGHAMIELVEYSAPRGRPKPENWRLSDQGIMNIAFYTQSNERVRQIIDRLDAEGDPPPMLITGEDVLGTYVRQRDREVELLSCPAAMEAELGFTPLGPFGRSDLIRMVDRAPHGAGAA